MKSNRIVLVAILLMSVPCSQAASGGATGVGGGGNMDVAAFYQTAESALQALIPYSPALIAGQSIDFSKLLSTLKTTTVHATTQNLTLNGAKVDAINYPDAGEINFNQVRWESMTSGQKVQLVIHEMIGVSRLIDQNYQVSSAAIQMLGLSSSYDATNLDSGKACEERRDLTKEKARRLAQTLAWNGIKPAGETSLKTLSLPSITCFEGSADVEGNELPAADCTPNTFSPAGAHFFNETFSFIGIFSEGTAGSFGFDAQNIVCSVDLAATQPENAYKCSVTAYWSWGCK